MRGKKRALPFVLLGILIAVNAFLIALLLRPEPEIFAEPLAQSPGSDTPTASGGSSSEPSSPPPSSSPSPESSISVSADADVVPVKRLITAASDREAWRATVGDCDTSGTVEGSTDGGKTWRSAVKSGLAPIVRIGIDGTGAFYTIGGAGQQCSTRYTAYSTDGGIVASTDNPLSMWFSRPKDRDQVYSPSKSKTTPCDESHVVGIASLSLSDALVICSNGSAKLTSDSGRSWKEADQRTGTMAVASGGGRYWTAGTSASCDGITVRSLTASDGELSRGPSRCVPVSQVTAGDVAIDVIENAIWVWAGQKVMTSTDGGQTWS